MIGRSAIASFLVVNEYGLLVLPGSFGTELGQ